MNNFLGKPSAQGIRWVARILGTLFGLLLLAVFIEWITGPHPPTTILDYMGAVVLLLIISGFVVGWFKELAAFLLVLGGTALVFVIWLLPSGGEWPLRIFLPAAILSFLFLYVHLATKKR